MFSRASENTELLRKEKTEGESGRRRFYETDKTHLVDIFSLGGRRAASVSDFNPRSREGATANAGIRKALAQSA